MMMKTDRRIHGILFIMLNSVCGMYAQSNQWNLWSGISLEKAFGKKWELAVNPEWRLEKWHDQNEYLLETSASYDPIPFLRVEGKYRLIDTRERELENNVSHQLAFDIKGQYKYERFKFQLRSRISNYSDFSEGIYFSNPYLRYRLKVEYNVKRIRLFPMASLELFHQLDDREINKLRYTLGMEYRLNGHQRIELEYHMQDYLKKEFHRNVVSLQYRFTF